MSEEPAKTVIGRVIETLTVGTIAGTIAGLLVAIATGTLSAPGAAIAFALLVLLVWFATVAWFAWRACGYSTSPPESVQRGIHLRLRARLGDTATTPGEVRTVRTVYLQLLSATLDAVDRFFGDADPAAPSRIGRLLGLRAPKPLWSASAYDRCLLIAVVYPVVGVFVFWWLSGDAGAAEEAFGLGDDVAAWRRSVLMGALVATSVCSFLLGTSRLAWALAVAVAAVWAGSC